MTDIEKLTEAVTLLAKTQALAVLHSLPRCRCARAATKYTYEGPMCDAHARPWSDDNPDIHPIPGADVARKLEEFVADTFPVGTP